jgi:Tn3 transposase DDE domain
MSPTTNSGDEFAASSTRARACTRCAVTCSSPTKGHIRRRHLDDQVDQALCLTLVTNAAVLWTTTYLADALAALHACGFPVTEATALLTPAQHDHINICGAYAFHIDAELRREGHRPLRLPD